jgi:hypothetical protein
VNYIPELSSRRELVGGFGCFFESVDKNHVLALPHKEI